MDQLSLQYPSWFIFLCILVGFGFAMLQYFRAKQWKEKTLAQRLLLFCLRFLSVALICFLLLHPLFKKFSNEYKKPLLIYVSDRSKSLVARDSNWLSTFDHSIESKLDALNEKFEVKSLYFGDKTSIEKQACNLGSSNMSSAFDFIQDQLDLQNLKSIIVSSDGIINEGSNPAYHDLTEISQIHTICLGDTAQEKDALIQRLFHNEIVYSGDQFSLQVDLLAFHCSGSTSKLTLSEYVSGQWQKLKEIDVNIKDSRFFQTQEFVINPEQAGMKQYRLQFNPVSGERNEKNNSKIFFIDVLDARKKVLIYAHSPHPDQAAIKDVLSSNKNYEVELVFAPNTINKPEQYSTVLFHQLPSVNFDLKPLVERLRNANIPLCFIVGSQMDINSFNQIQSILQISGNSKNMNEAQAVFKTGFNKFTVSDPLQQALQNYPPLTSPYGNYKLSPNATVLMFQKIGKIETNYPLWIFNDETGIRTAIICGEGIWKWRMSEFARLNNSDLFNELMTKTLQFVASKDDKRKFRVIPNKKLFNESESISFHAELYNDNFERITEPDVNIQIVNSTQERYDYTFSKANGSYFLELGRMAVGTYQYKAKTLFGGKQYESEGKFAVSGSDIELENLVADHQLLKNLSEKSGGISVGPNHLDLIFDQLKSDEKMKPIVYQKQSSLPLINEKWMFLIVFLAMALEWFLRRYWGSY
ncbi:MAG TPA: hypothetical protein PK006_04100 [Saprospiraceae bacterium]|nr:hypothetical protein [Saprospiraceae bacterium]